MKTMKEDLMSASIPVEQADVEESKWVTYMQELRLDYYKVLESPVFELVS